MIKAEKKSLQCNVWFHAVLTIISETLIRGDVVSGRTLFMKTANTILNFFLFQICGKDFSERRHQ